MLDEFQNLGKISGFTDIVSYARSSNIVFLLSIQSLNKLYDMYGINNIKNMLGNVKTKLVLASNSEVDTLGYISRLCGYTTIVDKTKVKTRLLEDDEIRRLKNNQILIIAHNKLPIIDEKYPLYL